MNREKVLAFMVEMAQKFNEDHVPDLMRARRVKECEELGEEYRKDPRFDEVAKYLIWEGSQEASLADFKTDELFSMIMFFYCFKKKYDTDNFNETYVISESAFVQLVCMMAESEEEVLEELADLLGMDECSDIEEFEYDEDGYHIVGLSMGVLINYESPDEEPGEEIDEDEEDE